MTLSTIYLLFYALSLWNVLISRISLCHSEFQRITWFHSRSHTFEQFWIKIEQLILKAPLGFGLKVTWSNNKVGTIGEHVKNRKLLISEHLVINKRLLCDLTSLISTLFTRFRPYQTTISVLKFRPCKNDDTRGTTWSSKMSKPGARKVRVSSLYSPCPWTWTSGGVKTFFKVDKNI